MVTKDEETKNGEIMENLCMRQGEKWSDWEVGTLNILSGCKVPQKIIGSVLMRTQKSIERKKAHLIKGRYSMIYTDQK